jgi:hypothetical protein
MRGTIPPFSQTRSVACTRKYCDRENIDLEILTDLNVLRASPPQYEKVVTGVSPVFVCAYVRLPSAWTVGRMFGI